MKYYIFFGLLAFILVLVGCTAFQTETPAIPPTPDCSQGEALVSCRCIECHDLIRVTSASYDQDGWEKTVTRMISMGAQLSKEEKTLVVNYLTISFPKE